MSSGVGGLSSRPRSQMGHELPRRFVAVAAATPHKADPPAGGCGVLRNRSQQCLDGNLMRSGVVLT
jgi:hypothetical protein